MRWFKLIISILIISAFSQARAQDQNTNGKGTKPVIEMQPVIGLQVWSVYTISAEIYDESISQFIPVEDRINFQLRRSRIGVKGSYGPRLKFNFTAAADLVGRDALAGTEGGQNNGGFPLLRIWNAWLQWKALGNSESVNITFGFFPPRIGRESMTPALKSPSMEKAWSQNYLRRHLVGTGPGRSVGLNIGGLIQLKKKLAFDYEAGIFNPILNESGNATSGSVTGPLLVSRVGIQVGEPEGSKYTLSKTTNYFGERRGMTVAFAGAYNKGQNAYNDNVALGIDWLINWDNLHFDGDWTMLSRNPVDTDDKLDAHTGYVRLGYNLVRNNRLIIMPALMYAWFEGATSESLQTTASKINFPSGREGMLEASMHFYFDKKYRLTFAYTRRTADSGEMGPENEINNYYSQSGIGPIKRGDWIGAGVVATF